MRAFLVALGATALAGGVAFAAGLPVASEQLSTITTHKPVPVETCTLQEPVADAFVDQLDLGLNHGSGSTLDVSSGTVVLAEANKRSLVRFDISSCSIPQAASVRSATLELFLSNAPAQSRNYQVARATAGWDETTVTWSNQPTAAPVTDTAASGTANGISVDWDVVADVRAFVSGSAANRGWRVKDSAEGATLPVTAQFGSRESATPSQRPSLVITYYP